jgi:hypothetical protein
MIWLNWREDQLSPNDLAELEMDMRKKGSFSGLAAVFQASFLPVSHHFLLQRPDLVVGWSSTDTSKHASHQAGCFGDSWLLFVPLCLRVSVVD